MKKRSRLSVKKKKVVGLFSFLLSVVPSSPPLERNSQKSNSKKKKTKPKWLPSENISDDPFLHFGYGLFFFLH